DINEPQEELPIVRRPPAPGTAPKGMLPRPPQQKPYSAMAAMEKMPPPPKKSPPLFIKLDKYKDLVKDIQTLKSYSLSLRDALDALSDIEKELQEGLSVINRSLDTFTIILSAIDDKMLKTEDLTKGVTEAPEEIDRYIKGVHQQIEKIREELKAISR
ncbi:MAG: hypothetical protein HY518_00200, partial [Candidatus Aenigmarchaeota archaeon]|nr:hypothetical protein [Candidatus Aenigmarchaeota archaeon]